jgi:hypothetical protein
MSFLNINPAAVTLTAITGAGLIALNWLTGDRKVDRRIFYPDTNVPQQRGGYPIRDIIPHVTIREAHEDALVITHHPVEQGAAISDHAYKHPATVVIEAGWSNSRQANEYGDSALLNVVTAMIPKGFGGGGSYLHDMYDTLLRLQANRQLVNIVTGKRTYASMLLERLRTVTDEHSERILLVSMEFRQVIIVRTQVITVPPASQQAQPELTSPTVNRGLVQPTQREIELQNTP